MTAAVLPMPPAFATPSGEVAMTVSFHPMIYDAQSASWRVVNADGKARDAFEFNLSNANATDLLAALGISPGENAEPYPIEALSHLVTAALRRRLGKRSPAQPAFIGTGDRGRWRMARRRQHARMFFTWSSVTLCPLSSFSTPSHR